MKYTFLLLISSISAFAQTVSVGVKGGVPINDAFNTSNQTGYRYETKRYIVGASLELGLPRNFALEVDGLYRRLGYDYTAPVTIGTSVTRNTVARQWEFPVLIKWYAIDGNWRPFLSAGGAFRHISGIRQTTQIADPANNTVDRSTIANAEELHARNSLGFVVGGGLAFKVGRFSITPELRYTRWGREAFRSPNGSDALRSNRDQGDFLLGLNF